MNKESLRMETQQKQQVNHHHHESEPGFTARPESKRHIGKTESLLGFSFDKASQSLRTKDGPYFESIFIKGCQYIFHK